MRRQTMSEDTAVISPLKSSLVGMNKSNHFYSLTGTWFISEKVQVHVKNGISIESNLNE